MIKIKSIALIIAAMLTLGLANVNAQGDGNKTSDDVTLNIRLSKIQSLVVNAGQKTVNLDYNTVNDYASGVTSEQKDHLEVFSTGGFSISAKASSETLNGVGENSNTINVSNIALAVTKGSDNNLTEGYLVMATKSNLNVAGKDIVKSTFGGRNLKFSVEYATDHIADAYINHVVKDETPTVYTTTITYTIAPQ